MPTREDTARQLGIDVSNAQYITDWESVMAEPKRLQELRKKKEWSQSQTEAIMRASEEEKRKHERWATLSPSNWANLAYKFVFEPLDTTFVKGGRAIGESKSAEKLYNRSADLINQSIELKREGKLDEANNLYNQAQALSVQAKEQQFGQGNTELGELNARRIAGLSAGSALTVASFLPLGGVARSAQITGKTGQTLTKSQKTQNLLSSFLGLGDVYETSTRAGNVLLNAGKQTALQTPINATLATLSQEDEATMDSLTNNIKMSAATSFGLLAGFGYAGRVFGNVTPSKGSEETLGARFESYLYGDSKAILDKSIPSDIKTAVSPIVIDPREPLALPDANEKIMDEYVDYLAGNTKKGIDDKYNLSFEQYKQGVYSQETSVSLLERKKKAQIDGQIPADEAIIQLTDTPVTTGEYVSYDYLYKNNPEAKAIIDENKNLVDSVKRDNDVLLALETEDRKTLYSIEYMNDLKDIEERGVNEFNQNKSVNEEVYAIQQQIEAISEEIDASQAKSLVKYINRKTGKLPDVGSNTIWGRKYDELYSELGYESLTEAENAIYGYQNAIQKRKELKDNLKVLQVRQDVSKTAFNKTKSERDTLISSKAQALQESINANNAKIRDNKIKLDTLLTSALKDAPERQKMTSNAESLITGNNKERLKVQGRMAFVDFSGQIEATHIKIEEDNIESLIEGRDVIDRLTLLTGNDVGNKMSVIDKTNSTYQRVKQEMIDPLIEVINIGASPENPIDIPDIELQVQKIEDTLQKQGVKIGYEKSEKYKALNLADEKLSRGEPLTADEGEKALIEYLQGTGDRELNQEIENGVRQVKAESYYKKNKEGIDTRDKFYEVAHHQENEARASEIVKNDIEFAKKVIRNEATTGNALLDSKIQGELLNYSYQLGNKGEHKEYLSLYSENLRKGGQFTAGAYRQSVSLNPFDSNSVLLKATQDRQEQFFKKDKFSQTSIFEKEIQKTQKAVNNDVAINKSLLDTVLDNIQCK